ncbi:MAG TPA: bifunctional (p)ppGpp synthetase/guanosine-3',5'-bis(diphosphate) 3'-pyrophosphohydrolase [Gammaproteobacteria bacterium]|jgi:GTP pyrophosphokinase
MDTVAHSRESRRSDVPRIAEYARLRAKLGQYLDEGELDAIDAAYDYSAHFHEGQVRQTGEPYITHPVAVAGLLSELRLDTATIQAALLHDVVEDTASTLEEIRTRFGNDVALLVDGVSKLDKLHFDSAEEAQIESFRKMLMAMAKDLRVILVKLADRTHNMRTIGALPASKRRRIARETLEIYAPIANRLGMYSLKVELEDLGFRAFAPFRYRVLERSLRKALGSQRQLLKKIDSQFKAALTEAGIEARVLAREKHIYSIYRKMQRKRVHLADVVDVYGVRVIVKDIETCYRVLGLAHKLFKPMPGRFKDYIAIPRVNGYQSLHTTLFGPKAVPLEVQIRTEQMDKVAESGIAANWLYKAVEKQTNSSEERARKWLSDLMELHGSGNSEEFLETVKIDLFPDKVYVFTPKGDILRLPRGATAVDFAYAVHTDVGNRCVAAKIDRRLVPLKTELHNGETVEIVTARGARPNPNWVNFVATAKARNAIRGFLKSLRGDEARDLGRLLLIQALRSHSLNLRRIPKARRQGLLGELGLADINELYAEIGLGRRLAPIIAGMLAEGGDSDAKPLLGQKPIEISGTEGLVVSYARCCSPIPDDEIVGFMTSGRGIVIHRAICRNLAEYSRDPSKWIPVSWKSRIKGEFSSEILVRTLDRVGLLAELAGRISSTGTNIEHVRVDSDDDSSVLAFRLKVRNRKHLAQVMRSIHGTPGVVRATRNLS